MIYPWAEYARRWRERHPERDRQSRVDWKQNNPDSYVFNKARSRAKHKNMEFTLTREWVTERLNIGFCEKTGLRFDMQLGDYSRSNPFTPTIDRRDNSKGYTPDNCRIVCWIYNCAKGPWEDDDVLRMARTLIEREYMK